MGRKPINEKAMTAAERQQRHREKNAITVIISTWQVPFEQTVQSITEFTYNPNQPETWADAKKQALDFINAESKKWWDQNGGDKSDTLAAGYQPVEELGYDWARYELWEGETGFHAMLDNESWWKLHEEHYQREFDDKGLRRPGYLINAYVAQGKDEYKEAQTQGLAEIEAHYGKPQKH